MFTSWGVSAAKGVAGTVMNTLTFYVVRFSAPALGFVLLAVADKPPGIRWVEVVSIRSRSRSWWASSWCCAATAGQAVGHTSGRAARGSAGRRPGGVGGGVHRLPLRHPATFNRLPALAAGGVGDAGR